jgi:hypothetical protein
MRLSQSDTSSVLAIQYTSTASYSQPHGFQYRPQLYKIHKLCCLYNRSCGGSLLQKLNPDSSTASAQQLAAIIHSENILFRSHSWLLLTQTNYWTQPNGISLSNTAEQGLLTEGTQM